MDLLRRTVPRGEFSLVDVCLMVAVVCRLVQQYADGSGTVPDTVVGSKPHEQLTIEVHGAGE